MAVNILEGQKAERIATALENMTGNSQAITANARAISENADAIEANAQAISNNADAIAAVDSKADRAIAAAATNADNISALQGAVSTATNAQIQALFT